MYILAQQAALQLEEDKMVSHNSECQARMATDELWP